MRNLLISFAAFMRYPKSLPGFMRVRHGGSFLRQLRLVVYSSVNARDEKELIAATSFFQDPIGRKMTSRNRQPFNYSSPEKTIGRTRPGERAYTIMPARVSLSSQKMMVPGKARMPSVVIDGMVTNKTSLSPQEIELLTALKNTGKKARPRLGNNRGVIIVTTKKEKVAEDPISSGQLSMSKQPVNEYKMHNSVYACTKIHPARKVISDLFPIPVYTPSGSFLFRSEFEQHNRFNTSV